MRTEILFQCADLDLLCMIILKKVIKRPTKEHICQDWLQ